MDVTYVCHAVLGPSRWNFKCIWHCPNLQPQQAFLFAILLEIAASLLKTATMQKFDVVPAMNGPDSLRHLLQVLHELAAAVPGAQHGHQYLSCHWRNST